MKPFVHADRDSPPQVPPYRSLLQRSCLSVAPQPIAVSSMHRQCCSCVNCKQQSAVLISSVELCKQSSAYWQLQSAAAATLFHAIFDYSQQHDFELADLVYEPSRERLCNVIACTQRSALTRYLTFCWLVCKCYCKYLCTGLKWS
jgi:hypothetical protein